MKGFDARGKRPLLPSPPHRREDRTRRIRRRRPSGLPGSPRSPCTAAAASASTITGTLALGGVYSATATDVDDMSSIIITSYYRYLNNLPINLNEQVEYYKEYWKNINDEEIKNRELEIRDDEFEDDD